MAKKQDRRGDPSEMTSVELRDAQGKIVQAAGLPTDSYVTGHKPKQTFQELVSQTNAGSFLPNEQGTVHKQSRKKQHKLAKKAEQLSPEQLTKLLDIMEGRALLGYWEGQAYLIRRADAEGISVQGMYEGAQKHYVAEDPPACSCPDFKFRGRECKHLQLYRGTLK